jgi:hypothetical protein
MGKPEECAGLLRMGLDPRAIAVPLGITTQSVIDYLYRAVGRQHISTADIVLSIPHDLREAAEKAVASLNTDYWFAVYRSIESGLEAPDRDLLHLYLHLRGTLLGDFYFHVIAVERALFSLIKSRTAGTYEYRYFRDLVKVIEDSSSAFADVFEMSEDFPADLHRANELRNRAMHPHPPFSPSDADFLFMRDLHHKLSSIGEEPATDHNPR